eukprot:3691297-Rhodomonas_salina.1
MGLRIEHSMASAAMVLRTHDMLPLVSRVWRYWYKASRATCTKGMTQRVQRVGTMDTAKGMARR